MKYSINKFEVNEQEVLFDDSKLTELGQYVSNPEYIRAYTDASGRFLWGIRHDGSIEWANGVPTPVKKYIESIDLENDEEVERINQLVIGLLADVKVLTDTYHYINDPEGRTEITLDTEEKILSFRDSNGVKHEHDLSARILRIESNLSMSPDAMSEFQKELKESGYLSGVGDWSDETHVQIPIPKTCAMVNIIAKNLPTSKVDNISGFIEYFGKDGNYFKKPILLNAQGNSSMSYDLKNLSIDIEDGSSVKFGHWVSQDSFHLKVYYIDVFRGINNINYNYAESIIQYLGCRSNRLSIKNTTIYEGTGNLSSDFNHDVLCHPDGFPIELYLNGEYHGLYAWNLKKHRANYMQDKNDATSTILDGYLDSTTFFGGNINWTQFELRNPKELATMDGQEYDSDTNCNEIIDESSEYYDSSNKAHVNSATIKPIIQKVASAIRIINELSSVVDKKAYFEEVFDKDMMICYFIVSNVVDNWDAFAKNWIWTIYYGGKAAPNFYDMDSCFGRWFTGTHIKNGADIQSILGVGANIPTNILHELYFDEIKTVYSELRECGLIDVGYIMTFFNDWVKRVGFEAYERNINKNSNIPSYRESHVNSEYWSFERNTGSSNTYNNDKIYEIGEEVYYGFSRFYKFRCLKQCAGIPPISEFYNSEPHELGMYDTPTRIEKWLTERIVFLDSYFSYNV